MLAGEVGRKALKQPPAVLGADIVVLLNFDDMFAYFPIGVGADSADSLFGGRTGLRVDLSDPLDQITVGCLRK